MYVNNCIKLQYLVYKEIESMTPSEIEKKYGVDFRNEFELYKIE